MKIYLISTLFSLHFVFTICTLPRTRPIHFSHLEAPFSRGQNFRHSEVATSYYDYDDDMDVDLTPKQQIKHNELWQILKPKLRIILNEYELNCLRKGAPFTRSKIEAELETCFNPSITTLVKLADYIDIDTKYLTLLALSKLRQGEIDLENDEQDAIKQTLIEPGCMLLLNLFKCFKPHNNYVIDKCSSEIEGLSWVYGEQLFVSVCKNNGSRIIEYLDHGGMECLESFGNSSLYCLKLSSNAVFDPKVQNSVNATSKTELCMQIDNQRSCFTNALEDCSKKKSVKALEPILSELEEWSKLKCSNDKTSESLLTMNGQSQNKSISSIFHLVILILPFLFLR